DCKDSHNFFNFSFPGIQWIPDENGVVTFDCRNRNWYIQAATSPKDVIIVVDVSGSMKGLRLTIAKHTINTILDTLGENDFVNIIAYSDYVRYVEPCFKGILVQADLDNREGQQVQEGAPEIPVPSDIFWLILVYPNAFLGQTGYIVPPILGSAHGFIPVGSARETSKGSFRCPNHLNRLLLMRRSSGSTLISPRITELLTLSLWLSPATLWSKLILATYQSSARITADKATTHLSISLPTLP
ncbi:hypothetical protein AMECASPLE_035616, partial [Ameca splendens]